MTNDRFVELVDIVRNALNMGPDDRPTLLKRLDVLVAQERGEEGGSADPEPAPLTVDNLSDEDRLGYALYSVINSFNIYHVDHVYLTGRDEPGSITNRNAANERAAAVAAEHRRILERDFVLVPRDQGQGDGAPQMVKTILACIDEQITETERIIQTKKGSGAIPAFADPEFRHWVGIKSGLSSARAHVEQWHKAFLATDDTAGKEAVRG